MRRILSIDGGGLKGIIPAAFLAGVEDQINGNVGDYFDLIAGTSTGAIIALGLALGLPAAEILAFYETEGARIFHQETISPKPWIDALLRRAGGIFRRVRRTFVEKYDSTRLADALRRVFGTKTIGDCRTRVIKKFFCRQRMIYSIPPSL